MRPGVPAGTPRVARLVGDDVVERLDHGATEHPRHPLAVGQTALDLGDATVSRRVVVPRVDNDSRRCGQDVARQLWHRFLRDGDDDHVLRASGLLHRRCGRAGFRGQRG